MDASFPCQVPKVWCEHWVKSAHVYVTCCCFRQHGYPFQLPQSFFSFHLSLSIPLKKVLCDRLMQDYWIKVQGSCTNLPLNLLTSVSDVTYNTDGCDTQIRESG